MSTWNRGSIRGRLFGVIVAILICNVVILLIMGSTLFERFYQHSKISELESSAKRILHAYQQNSGTIYDEISAIEDENVTVCLYTWDGQTEAISVSYYSRFRLSEPPGTGDVPIFVKGMGEHKLEEIILNQLAARAPDWLSMQTGDTEVYQNAEQGKSSGSEQDKSGGEPKKIGGQQFDAINLLMCVDKEESLYLLVDTPLGYIRSIANLAVRYTAGISIAILLAGAIVIYFVVGRITRPISSIRETAEQISQLDFSRRCEAGGDDEIAALARSINNMADNLQASVDKLVQANEVLTNDLIRQQQTDKMRREFIANVSHDFKTPLTLIISYAEALAQETQNEQEREFCQIILSEGEKLSQMVGRLLELSKMESGVEELTPSIFCLDEIIDGVCSSQKLPAAQKGITVTCTREDSFIVHADYQKIERAVMNLFENALKYTPQSGSITVETAAAQEAGKCTVRIVNTGTQIDGDDIENIFDSFYRADKSRSGDRQSYGLGLAIVRATMQAHGERYGVENMPDGVCFWIELSLAEGMNDE